MIRRGWIYILHFGENIEHAKHYTGSTHNIRERLRTHANGMGSCLTREFYSRNIPFVLGAVGETSHEGLRKLERRIKIRSHVNQYCRICMKGLEKKIPTTLPIDVSGITWQTDAISLRDYEVRVELPEMGKFEIVNESIRKLMQDDKDKLGFIPAGGSRGVLDYLDAQHCITVWKGSILVGYCLFTVNKIEEKVSVMQICIDDKHRCRGLGRRVLNTLARMYRGMDISAKVRDDLAANEFWSANDFHLIERYVHEKTGSEMNHYLFYNPPF